MEGRKGSCRQVCCGGIDGSSKRRQTDAPGALNMKPKKGQFSYYLKAAASAADPFEKDEALN